MKNRQFIVGGLIVALSASAMAEQGGGVIRREEPPRSEREIERQAVNFAGPLGGGTTANATRVVGTVIDIRQTPVPKAALQLRNLDTGEIEQVTESDDLGEYEFELEEPGTFVVEMILTDGYILALSNAGALAQFDTLNTVVQLPGRWDAARAQMVQPQPLSELFGMSAQTTLTAATLEVAVNDSVAPTNPGVKVSP